MNVPPTGQEAWRDAIEAHLRDGAAVRLAVIDSCLPVVVEAATAIVRCLQAGGTVYFCGNGGSAADAQHLAAELVGRYLHDRKALAGVALTTDTSVLTAVGNDLGYATIFERQVNALVRKGDVLIALSTSGHSENVIRAVTAAKNNQATVIGMTGSADSPVSAAAQIAIRIPSLLTPFIQEMHLAVGHAMCEVIEASLLHSHK